MCILHPRFSDLPIVDANHNFPFLAGLKARIICIKVTRRKEILIANAADTETNSLSLKYMKHTKRNRRVFVDITLQLKYHSIFIHLAQKEGPEPLPGSCTTHTMFRREEFQPPWAGKDGCGRHISKYATPPLPPKESLQAA